MISVSRNVLRFVSFPRIWSNLANVPCAIKKKARSAICGCRVLQISIKSSLLNVLVEFSVSLLTFFCLLVFSVRELC